MERQDEPGAPEHQAKPPVDELRGALFMTAACTFYAVGFGIIKYLTGELPEPVIGLFRSFFATLCFLPIVLKHGRRFLATARPFGHVWRAVLGFSAFLFFIYALSRIPLGDAVALSFTTPFWAILIGILFFHDRFTLRLGLQVLAGFAGMLLVAQPTSRTGLNLGAILALSSAVLTALAMSSIKSLVGTEPPQRVAFYFMLLSTVIAIIPSCFDWQLPAPQHWLPLIVTGITFYVAQNCLTLAYYHGTFSRVASLDFIRLPASLAVGFLLFGEVPGALALGGMFLILLAALDILRIAQRGRVRP